MAYGHPLFYLNQLKNDLIASIKLLKTSFNLSKNDCPSSDSRKLDSLSFAAVS